MLLLVTKSMPEIRRMGPNVGRLIQPRHLGGLGPMSIEGPWAADNDAFQGFKAGPFLKMLGSIAGLPKCLFVVAPDVVADAEATLDQFDRWQPIIRDECGLPVALAIQDGIEKLPSWIPWRRLDAVFLGGSTLAKMSTRFADIAKEAKEQGKWVHMGRVNTINRMRYAASIGCDSIDGTKWARWTDTYIHELEALNYHQQALLDSSPRQEDS